MCLGAISILEGAWDDAGARVGKLDDGRIVSLSFVPDAVAGEFLLLHLGIPVEVLAPDIASDALALRSPSLSLPPENGASS